MTGDRRTGLPAFGHQDGRSRHGTSSPVMNWSPLPIGSHSLYWTKSKNGFLNYDYKTFALELITPRRAQLLCCLISRLDENFETHQMAVNVAFLPPLLATAFTTGSKYRDYLHPPRLPVPPLPSVRPVRPVRTHHLHHHSYRLDLLVSHQHQQINSRVSVAELVDVEWGEVEGERAAVDAESVVGLMWMHKWLVVR